MVHRNASLKRHTKYDSAPSCSADNTTAWNLRFFGSLGQSPLLICNKNRHDIFMMAQSFSPKIDIEIITIDMNIAGTKQDTCTYLENASLLHRRWYDFWYAWTSVNALLELPQPLYLSGIFTIFVFGCFLLCILKEFKRYLSTPCPLKCPYKLAWNMCMYTCIYVCTHHIWQPSKNFIADYFTEFHSNYSYLYTDLYFCTLIIYTGF